MTRPFSMNAPQPSNYLFHAQQTYPQRSTVPIVETL